MVESSKTRRRDASLEKEENAAKKMKMTDTSGVGEKILQGEVPSTKEIKQVIDQAKESLGDQGLTSQGKRLASDIKDVLDSSKLLLDKNKGEKLQNFLKYASDFSEEVATRGQKLGEKTSDEQYQAMKEASDLAQNIRGAVVFSLQSGDFRQLLGDYVELMQNIAGMFRDAAKSGDMQKAKKAVEKASLSDEQKKDLKNRFAELMKRVSQNKEFNKAFNNLFSIFDALQSTFMKAKKEAKKPFESESFDNMMSEVDGLIIEFCGKDDWNRFKKDFWALLESIQNDKPAAEFFEDLRFHVRASLENPYDVTSGPMMRRGQELLEKAFKLMDTGKDKYRGKFRSLFDDMQSLLDNLANDKALTSIGESLGKLSQDLFTDSQGKPDVYVAQESISQLKQIFLPAIREKLENIPLPRIEGSNDTYDYYVENMLFNGSDILPDAFHIQVLNDVKMDSNEPARDKMMTQVDLSISNIRLEFKNMNFFYRRKVIPKIEDYGTANVEIGGEGLKLKMSWKLVSKSDEPIKMDLADVTCNIDELNIQILDAKHSIIDGIISNMFPGYIKDVLTQSIVDKIKETVAPFNDQMNEFFRKQREIYNQKMDELGEKLKEKIQ